MRVIYCFKPKTAYELRSSDWSSDVCYSNLAGTAYGDGDLGQEQGQGQVVNVEYVSANPTGPLTVGHARGAVVGDALSALLAKVGYKNPEVRRVGKVGLLLCHFRWWPSH